LTQATLAQRLGTSPSYIANLEAGRLNLTLGQLARIAGALDADLQIGMSPLAVTATAVREPAAEA
jgi:transcriptional regulator with XRE-family HTH domain